VVINDNEIITNEEYKLGYKIKEVRQR